MWLQEQPVHMYRKLYPLRYFVPKPHAYGNNSAKVQHFMNVFL